MGKWNVQDWSSFAGCPEMMVDLLYQLIYIQLKLERMMVINFHKE